MGLRPVRAVALLLLSVLTAKFIDRAAAAAFLGHQCVGGVQVLLQGKRETFDFFFVVWSCLSSGREGLPAMQPWGRAGKGLGERGINNYVFAYGNALPC